MESGLGFEIHPTDMVGEIVAFLQCAGDTEYFQNICLCPFYIAGPKGLFKYKVTVGGIHHHKAGIRS